MSLEQELITLKRNVESARRTRDEAAGALKTVEAQLKKDHGVKGLVEAKSKLAKMKKEIEKKETALEEQLEALESEWEWE